MPFLSNFVSLLYINGYIFNSFVEAGLYSSQRVRQILEGKHVRRGLQAHLTAVHKSVLMHILEKQIQTCEHVANSFLESIEKNINCTMNYIWFLTDTMFQCL